MSETTVMLYLFALLIILSTNSGNGG